MAIQYGGQITFGMFSMQELLDPTDDLVKLAGVINWEDVHDKLVPYYSNVGRQGLPVRLMVGLHILKHKFNMSDDQCTSRLRGDMYWMYFCGVDTETLRNKFQHLNSATMTKFRKRIGAKGFSEVEGIIKRFLVINHYVSPREMCTDSTCQPKNIVYPTDSSLLNKGRNLILKGIQRLEILGVKSVKGLRTFSRRSKQIVLNIAKLGKDREARIKAGTLELGRQARHVLGKGKAMVKKALKQAKAATGVKALMAKKLSQDLENNLKLLERVIHQARARYKGTHISGKVYSFKEPEVIVIRKGKSHCPNEYGSKLNLSTDINGFIVNHEVYQANHHDSTLLEPALEAWERAVGTLPDQVNTDRGYNQKKKNLKGRITKIKRVCTPYCGKKKNPNTKTSWFKRGQRLRSTIEGVIAHLKQDHRLNVCRYSGSEGNSINATLAVAAWNLTKLSRQI